MIEVEGRSIGAVFDDAARMYGARDWLVVPADPQRAWLAAGACIGYAQGAALVSRLAAALSAAGYGPGHRIAFLLGNRPEMLLLKLACNRIGVSWVPVNPDYREAEIAWLLQDAGVAFVLAATEHEPVLRDARAHGSVDTPLVFVGDLADEHALLRFSFPVPQASTPVLPAASSGVAAGVDPATEASLLYTSGTTGRPKGCVLSHAYELSIGAWYATRGGRITLAEGGERIYCPLPLFHVNAAILLFFAMIVSGNCQIVAERFSRTRWWPEIRATRASAMHYLGIVVASLMNEPAHADDRDHGLRWGLGAGVEPSLHVAFEARFGCPLVELWGMTEMCRILVDCDEPRRVATRAMGRPQPGLEVRVVDGDGRDVAPGESGEMLVRHSAATPREGAFSGYLNLPDATAHAWRSGWFHTGDTVFQEPDGMVHFVDRSKNIIRRAGENISAAEVEACLQAHPRVEQVAVIAIEDGVREEEVMACVVVAGAGSGADAPLARALFDHAFERLAYYKAPGWIVFVPTLPVTGTQKIAKHRIFGDGQDPRRLADAHDLRSLKRRRGR